MLCSVDFMTQHYYILVHFGCLHSLIFFFFFAILEITVLPPASPTVTVSPDTNAAASGNNIPLQCTWNVPVYCIAWYFNGVLLYKEYFAPPFFRMIPQQGIYILSNFTLMMSTLTIDNATLDDSGNYTCAVTCGARGMEFGMIAANLQDTTEVFVYGEY